MSNSEEEIKIKYVEKLADEIKYIKPARKQKQKIMRRVVKQEEKQEKREYDPYERKKRRFQLTIHNTEKYDDIVDYIIGRKNLLFMISCYEECPKTGKPHFHIYCHFSNSVALSRKKCWDSHLELCRGTVRDNINYIKKEGKYADKKGKNDRVIEVWGEEPPNEGGHIYGGDLPTMTDQEICEIDPRCHKAYINAREIMNNPIDIDIDSWNKNIRVIYIQGPSGCGKTEMAKEIVRKQPYINDKPPSVNIVKCQDGFWHGIGNSKIAIYDEFRSSSMKASEFINFIDYNRHLLNVKGGSRRNNYEIIIITSVEKLSDIYKNMSGEPRLQWERRTEVINMFTEEDI